jgi:hypothetical protein
MIKQSGPTSKYIRIRGTEEVWAQTLKVASTSMQKALPKPVMYTELQTGDHVRMIVRDPRDRLVSAWRWFTGPHNSYIPEVPEHVSRYLLDKDTEFKGWVETAVQNCNEHWVPQTTIHPRWREFELIPITDLHKLGWGHEKKLRSDNTWEQYYDDGLLALVNEIYKEDVEMYKEATNEQGNNTGTNRVL